MTNDSITSFVVRCQHVSEVDSQIKVKLTHVQSNKDIYFDQLEDAFDRMKEIVSDQELEKR
ncbi:hypothetical protein [Aquisalibacillus elongatus]|uniref:Uncharacterized protein n=1 Tax=Aquisalibacillus elongatus TaxID=485577 RepID=A0A3N5BSX0_9BACI|nr:hypothetical protein [Aquisalibacillus elongatus]RPF50592.1 hypothetical protein EDC24_2559 [Aquisalibacillus elongatus]